MYLHTEKIMNTFTWKETNGYIEFFIEGIDQPVQVVLPPNKFPNHMFLLNEEEMIKRNLQRFEIEAPPITIGEINYLGVIVQKGNYQPHLCELPIVDEIHPVASEKINRTTAWYVYEQNAYYCVQADPLRDVASGRAEEIKNRTLHQLKQFQHVVFYPTSYQQQVPIGFYKGYAPIVYFAEELGFNEQWTPNTEVIVNGKSLRGKKLKTFSEFSYYLTQKNKKIENSIKIYDQTLFGRKVPIFEVDDFVRIVSPKGDKASLKGLEGKVSHVTGLTIGVTFFDYFHTSFSPFELEKTES